MDRFLNRLLLLPIEQQNDVLAFFFQIYSTLVETSRFHGLTDDDYSVESLNIQSGIRHPLAVVDHEVFWIDPVSRKYTGLVGLFYSRASFRCRCGDRVPPLDARPWNIVGYG